MKNAVVISSDSIHRTRKNEIWYSWYRSTYFRSHSIWILTLELRGYRKVDDSAGGTGKEKGQESSTRYEIWNYLQAWPISYQKAIKSFRDLEIMVCIRWGFPPGNDPSLPLTLNCLAARPSTIYPLKRLYGAGGMRAIWATFFLLYFQRFSFGRTSLPPERSTSGAQRWNVFDGNHRRRGQRRSFVFFFILFLVQPSRRAISLFASAS